MKKITIIGAGIVGVATAAYLRRDGHDVTVVDMRPPGEYCSFGNAGILSPGSCVPLATPGHPLESAGLSRRSAGTAHDPLGLSAESGAVAAALPRGVAAAARRGDRRRAAAAAASRRSMRTSRSSKHAGVTDLIRQTGYVVAYEKRASYLGDALAWKLRRERGVAIEELDDAGREEARAAAHRRITKRACICPSRATSRIRNGSPRRSPRSSSATAARILQREVHDIEVGPDGPARARHRRAARMPVETLVDLRRLALERIHREARRPPAARSRARLSRHVLGPARHAADAGLHARAQVLHHADGNGPAHRGPERVRRHRRRAQLRARRHPREAHEARLPRHQRRPTRRSGWGGARRCPIRCR